MSAEDDAIGPDGTVRLRRYLPIADTHWFSALCPGCGRTAPVGVRGAIEAAGSGDATVGQLARRLRCAACGGRRIGVVVVTDSRPPWVRERDGVDPRARAAFGPPPGAPEAPGAAGLDPVPGAGRGAT